MHRLTLFAISRRFGSTLSPRKITELLTKNEIAKSNPLPYIKSVECNQLASNSPIEDRLRVSSLILPNSNEPTLILGVFDGHGGGATADLISRRLFDYIAISLHPEPKKLKTLDLEGTLVDLHNSPMIFENADPKLKLTTELDNFKVELANSTANNYDNNIAAKLKDSFRRCDDDLAREIQKNLTNPYSSQDTLHYYLAAAVSGCCAIVMVIHQGIGYLASAGDCRAVLGIHNKDAPSNKRFQSIELNEEHNCDNINEVRRLANSHPQSEQNTMIKHNRLLGHLMPFRAFGDFTYKWPVELIKACGITRAFGSGVIPSNYKTPPYLTAEPDVSEVKILENGLMHTDENKERWLIIATDGLWELFESSRDVVETVVDHSINASHAETEGEYDQNSATHILRAALQSGSQQDYGSDTEELKRLHHIRLESTLTLPQAVVRNFRDDISIIVLKL